MIEIKKFSYNNQKLMSLSHAIRKTVFVVEQKCPAELEWEYEKESTHFLIFYNRKPVATARHRKTKKGYKLERFAVLKEERGKGYGHKVLKAILEDLKNFSGLIYMHAQCDVVPFYEKLNFKKIGDIFEEAGILHYKMILSKI